MTEEPAGSTRIPYTLFTGTTFFIIGLITDDLYIVLAGLSLIIIWHISATGGKIVQHIDNQPKGL